MRRFPTILQKLINLIKNNYFFYKESYLKRIILMNSQILLNYQKKKTRFLVKSSYLPGKTGSMKLQKSPRNLIK